MHLDSVAIDNQTADPLSVRVSVDRWFNAYECDTGDALGSLDRDATFTVEAGEMLCLRGEASREPYDAREHVRSLALVRQGQRCFYGTHEQLREAFGRKVRGFRVFEVNDEVCGPAGSRAGATAATR